MPSTNIFTALFFSLITCFFSTSSFAQNYPNKPVTVIVPFSAGSASDVVTRVLLDKVSNNTGTRFVFDNRPAAGGNVGTAALVRAESADPSDPSVPYARATVLARLGKLDEARSAARRALELDPNSAAATCSDNSAGSETPVIE